MAFCVIGLSMLTCCRDSPAARLRSRALKNEIAPPDLRILKVDVIPILLLSAFIDYANETRIFTAYGFLVTQGKYTYMDF